MVTEMTTDSVNVEKMRHTVEIALLYIADNVVSKWMTH